MMGVMIAHASIDEHNRVSGGKAGDQTGKEVCVRSWYSKPWGCVIRFQDARMAEKVAQAMEMAAANNRIGYNQNQRNTLLKEARKHNYDISKVAVPCETDCSALVSVACMYAGVPESALTLMGNCAHTRNLKQMLKATGEVDIYNTALYTNKPDRLKRGDILLKEGSHVAVVVKTDNIIAGTANPYRLTATLLRKGSSGENVKWLQYELRKHGYIVDVDGDFGPNTETAVRNYQTMKGLGVDGVVGAETIQALRG